MTDNALPASIEERLTIMFRDILRVDEVSPDEDFFDLGGHSLLANRLAFRIREMFGIPFPVASIFEAPTIRLLAEQVRVAMAD